MSSIVIIGDVHDEQDRLRSSLDLVSGRPADLVLLVGDVGEDPPWTAELRKTQRENHDESVRRVVSRIRKTLDCPLVFVPGNHDLPEPTADMDGVNADRKIVEVAGLRIAGFGGAGPTRFGFAYEWKEDEADEALQRLFADAGSGIDIFLSHTPPANTTLDRTARGEPVGSSVVKRWLERVRPRLFVCGHIHEAWGVEWLWGVPCLNAGAFGPPHAEEIAWRVEWEQGPVRIVSFVRGPDGGPVERLWEPPRVDRP
jgi:Icc-related predicted phosphoesterase